jgi:sarcosine oxidase
VKRYRVAVIGAGGIGSATAYWLSKRIGAEVLCLEQWALGHGRGASEDHSRIIRMGYHAAAYTALVRDSYEAWAVAERESGVPLVLRTGMLNLARPHTEGAEVLGNYAASMAAFGIDFEQLDARDVRRRWPQFRLDDDHRAVWQADGGILDIRRGVAVQLALARRNGATVLADAGVTAITERGDHLELHTPAGDFTVEQLVVCAGAWTSRLLDTQLGLRWPIRLTREQVTYFATPNLREFAADRFPIFITHDEADYYGFPVYGEVATKAATEDLGDPVGLDDWSWQPDPARVRRVAEHVEALLPGFTGPELYTRCCLYDMPPDRDFVVDRLPGHPRIAVAIGAGHAAKFAGVLGRILSELVLDGATRYPIDAFRADRPALVDPSVTPTYRLAGSPVPT